MGYQFQPADLRDFTGGMTDDYVGASPRQCQKMQNFVLMDNKSLRTRPGTILDNFDEPNIPLGFVRLNGLRSYENKNLLVFSGKKIYYRDPSSYVSLLGPTSNNPFESGTTYSNLAYANWNKHLIVTNDSFNKPIKIYKDGSNVLQMRTAGLPALASNPTLTDGSGTKSFIYGFCYSYEYTVGD